MTSVDPRAEGLAPPEETGHEACDAALRRAFQFLGKRWNGVILAVLGQGPMGFAELRRSVGAITDSVLSDRLTELSLAGLVDRSVSDARPPGVRYQLTDAGTSLLPVFAQLTKWSVLNLPEERCTGH
ncbi:helix-turn-helix domain-containing protein [Amycolatopsis sp.]|uniref:winged helix-turn-helix transcriptional regulator n=1 Tax=Amycolatopsis sp. TaxID=37632 RepID=UPI002BE10D67|nr:helix-turn-helix domain-containing protein [Amycolatopsis sp.]HVV13094.1 helix-turn-helix domain-containing protein [Amycolatopsis sp.]